MKLVKPNRGHVISFKYFLYIVYMLSGDHMSNHGNPTAL